MKINSPRVQSTIESNKATKSAVKAKAVAPSESHELLDLLRQQSQALMMLQTEVAAMKQNKPQGNGGSRGSWGGARPINSPERVKETAEALNGLPIRLAVILGDGKDSEVQVIGTLSIGETNGGNLKLYANSSELSPFGIEIGDDLCEFKLQGNGATFSLAGKKRN